MTSDRWHDALTIALDQGLRLIAVDALEGLAVTAASIERWAESLLLLGVRAAAPRRDWLPMALRNSSSAP